MQVIWELNYDDCSWISAFGSSLRRVEESSVERRQGTAVVRCCQNHIDKLWLTSSAVGSIPA